MCDDVAHCRSLLGCIVRGDVGGRWSKHQACVNVNAHVCAAVGCVRTAQLYWPDDRKWYLVEIQSVDVKRRRAK